MVNTQNNTLPNHSLHGLISGFFLLSDEQVIYVAVEILLIVGAIWLIFKKRNSELHINLSKSEEEAVISEYTPESLVPEISPTHPALRKRVIQGKVGLKVVVNGVEGLNFASHDYLGFIGNAVIEDKSKKCVDTYGVGTCGPRVFYGTTILHLELEKLLAKFLGTEDSIVFSYGFATMETVIPAYAKKNDIVFVDEKCNFAIQQGLRASKSEIKYFKHNDVQDLKRILEKTKTLDMLDIKKAHKTRRFLIVEGIYLNSGQICDLPNILNLCKKHKLRILIDESISFGVLGKTGRGITEYFGIPRNDIDLIMGSLEFTFASLGGFCAGSRLFVDHLVLAAVGYIFSASLPPLLIQACITVMEEIENNLDKLVKLQSLNNFMFNKLTASAVLNEHFTISGDKNSPVHVLTVRGHHDNQTGAIDNILGFCLNQNIAVSQAAFLDSDIAMTRPSLRITTNVNHTEEHISYLVIVLEAACRDSFN